MKPNPVVILHGWNDTSTSFTPLAAWLQANGFRVIPIFLGDYLTLNDEITLKDLGSAFQLALTANRVAQSTHAFDCIVHSTGGLVVREYLRQVCEGRPEDTPIQNLLMYSPANFGSPLAAMGKSVLGRLFFGWGWDHVGQTGTAILSALELASPYSWDLAIADLLSDSNSIFDPKNTLVTVLTGTAAYPGIQSVVHENGSDGTVRVSTANLNAALVRLDCHAPDPIALQLVEKNCPRIALAVLDRDHSDTHNPDPAKPQAAQWVQITQAALTIDPTQYTNHLALCDQVSQQTFANGLRSANPERYHQYQTLIVRVHDQFGVGIPDYVVEFYQEAGDDQDAVFTEIHGDILEKVTTNSLDPSYRSFLFDMDALNTYVAANPATAIEMSVTAAQVSNNISYRNPKRGIPVFIGAGAALARPNTLLLIDVTLYRDTAPGVFKLTLVP